MTSSVRILTTATIDSTPSLVLIAPNGDTILVNCGEGCQRSFLETPGLKVKSVSRICLTHLHPTSMGGLPGLLLTTADTADSVVLGKKQTHLPNKPKGQRPPLQKTGEIELYGPKGLRSFVYSLRHFMRRDRFETRVFEGSGIYQKKCASRKRKKTPISPEKQLNFTIQSLEFQHSLLGQATPISSYIFSTSPLAGKFRPDQAEKLGIPRGPLYAQLKQGKSVTFKDPEGNISTVHSHQVLEDGLPGIAVAVVYCPSRNVFIQLKECQELINLKKLASEKTTTNIALDIMIHMTPQKIAEDEEYKQWMKSFKTVDRIWFNTYEHLPHCEMFPGNSPFVTASVGAMMRSMIQDDIYLTPIINKNNNTNFNLDGNTIVARQALDYTLLPRTRRGIDELVTTGGSIQEKIEESSSFVKKSGALERGATVTNSFIQNADSSIKYEILFTGTGSAVPCKHRNVSGICLTLQNENRILIDCGEGTLGQILRSKPHDTRSLLASIKAIWISHPHADHHLGIMRILSERKAVTKEPLILLASPSIFNFLFEYESIDPTICDSYLRLDSRELIMGKRLGGLEIKDKKSWHILHSCLGINSIRTVPVAHCRDAFAIIIDFDLIGRFAYSGDCRPSIKFADAAADANILIHEATFEDGMEGEAVLKRHSTVGEALSVARRMQAKNIILTHFSQRYPRIPPLSQNSDENRVPIVFAFDFMRLSPDTIPLAAKLTESLRLLYPEDKSYTNDTCKSNGSELISVPGIFAQSNLL